MKYIVTIFLFIPFFSSAQIEIPWLLQSKGKSNEFINDMSIDNNDHVYITGQYFDGSMQLGDSIFAKGGTFVSGFITKLDEYGDIIWAKSLTGSLTWPSYAYIDSDDDGNTYLLGSFAGKKMVIGTDTIYSSNKVVPTFVVYILKFDPLGNLLFSKVAEDENGKSSTSQAILVDSKNKSIYAVIDTESAMFQIDSLVLEHQNKGMTQMIVKWDLDGNPLWGKVLNDSWYQRRPFDLSLDSRGNIALTGNMYGSKLRIDSTVLFNPNIDSTDSSCYIVKFTPEGKVLWANVISSITDFSSVANVTSDIDDNIVVNGRFRGEKLIVGADTILHRNIEPYYWDYFIIKYNPEGEPLWIRSLSFGQTFYPGGLMDTDNKGNLYGHWMYSLPEMQMGMNKVVNNGFYDNIITKHSSKGELLWAKGYGGDNTEAPANLLVDSEDNLIIGCRYWSDLWEFENHTVENEFLYDSIIGEETANIFIAKIIPDTTTSLTNIKTASFDVKAHYSSSDNGVVLDIQGQPQSIDLVIKMYDLTGHELVISASNISSEKYLIDINKIPNGVYVIRVQFDNEYKSVLVTIID